MEKGLRRFQSEGFGVPGIVFSSALMEKGLRLRVLVFHCVDQSFLECPDGEGIKTTGRRTRCG